MKPKSKITSSKNPIADIMNKNTSKILRKIEMRFPYYVRAYSDFNREYHKSLEEICKTFSAAEKKFFEGKHPDSNFIRDVDEYWNSLTRMYVTQIDASTELLKNYLDIRLSTMRSWNNLMQSAADRYIKSLQISPNVKK